MHLLYDDDFVEAAVFLCASRRRGGAPALQIRRFHAERERCYSVADPDERNTAFFRVHLAWFREWGLEQLIAGLLKEYPLLPGALDVLAFRQARGRNEEGAELYVSAGAANGNKTPTNRNAGHGSARFQSDPHAGQCSGSQGARNAMVSISLERFERDDRVLRFLRHEFMHLHDMVDPVFGYSPRLDLRAHNPAQHRITRERYRLLWDITIDGRLARAGRDTMTTRDRHEALFDRAFSFWAEEKRRQVFAAHWEDGAPRHENLLALAADPRDLSHAHEPLPGGLCPLCGFPTFEWADVPALNAETISLLRAQFPHWTAAQGACKRCVEIYELAGKFEAPPTMVL